MTKFLTTLLIFLISSSSSAKSTLQKSALETVIEAMARQYVESAAKDYAVKRLETYASEALKSNLTGDLSAVLAGIDLINNIHAYGDAKSESQRYQAMSHAIADAATLANPAVGSIIQLGMLGEDLTAAYISKESQLRQQKLIEEITHDEKLTSDMVNTEFQNEKKELLDLSSRATALSVLAKTISNSISSVCVLNNGDIKEPLNCFNDVLLYQQVLSKQIRTAYNIACYNGRFFNPTILAQTEYKKSEMDQIIKNADVSLKSSILTLRAALRQFSTQQVISIRNDVEKSMVDAHCEGLLITSLSNILKIEKEKSEGSDPDNDWLSDALHEEMQNLDTLSNGLCAEPAVTVDPDLRNFIKKTLNSLN
ncbi:MAG: hypothetical protein ACXVCY_12175 [Pseudobdellovibrionaceae bacterium]